MSFFFWPKISALNIISPVQYGFCTAVPGFAPKTGYLCTSGCGVVQHANETRQSSGPTGLDGYLKFNGINNGLMGTVSYSSTRATPDSRQCSANSSIIAVLYVHHTGAVQYSINTTTATTGYCTVSVRD
jgi:hypothetical protein